MQLFEGDARQEVVQYVCEKTGLPADTVEAVLHALVTGDLNALEALAEEAAWHGLDGAMGAMVPYVARPATAAEHHVGQLLATKDKYVDDIKAMMQQSKDEMMQSKEQTIAVMQQMLHSKEQAMAMMLQSKDETIRNQDEQHRHVLALKDEVARQLALRMLDMSTQLEAARKKELG